MHPREAVCEIVKQQADLGSSGTFMHGSNTANALSMVGIGASAGGLEALRDLVGSLHPEAPYTYVIAQHVSPTHVSLLMNLLAPLTQLQVRELQPNQQPEHGVIYITPPNRDVTISNGMLGLAEPQESVGPKPSINRFFNGLATELGERAIGIILSGTGSDGAAGIQAIKAEGGITIVQDPATAKYDGMPKSAIRTGAVDIVIPSEQIGRALERLRTAPVQLSASDEDSSGDDIEAMATLVRRHTGFDLNDYKRATIERRISRRLSMRGLSSAKEYLKLLREDRRESLALVRDCLITVTAFFRDPEAFASLCKIIEDVVSHKGTNDVIRCWVPGCATGEEVYSLAILFVEAILAKGDQSQFLIFASDLDEDAIERARSATYPLSALDQVPAAFRERHFEVIGDQCRIRRSLKQKVIFAHQNVIDDPPFSRLELISCRNLLIYLNQPVQQKLLELFHYALNPGGYLLLGKSESIEAHRDLFLAVDLAARIYQRREGVSHYAPPIVHGVLPRFPSQGPSPKTSKGSIDLIKTHTYEQLAQRYAPPSLVITSNDTVRYCTGQVKPFLEFPTGPISTSLFDLVDAALCPELRALIYRCRRDHKAVQGTIHRNTYDGQEHKVRPVISPLHSELEDLLLLSFEPIDAPVSAHQDGQESNPKDSLIITELERELAHTRAQLQTLVEELETSNEELQSLNEELQSSNEELQSTNQELQTSNEELQSTNEELLTINDELQLKSAEQEQATADLANIKESLCFPMLVVNKELGITHTNQATEQIAVFEGPLEGQNLTTVQWKVNLPNLSKLVREVMERGHSHEQVITDADAHFFLLNLMPYRGGDKMVNGAVLLFQDITSQRRAEDAQRASEQRYALVVDGVNDGLWDWNVENNTAFVSRRYKELLGYQEHEMTKPREAWMDLLHPDDKGRVLKTLDASLQKGTPYQDEYRLRHKSGEYIWISARGVVVRNEAGKPVRMAGFISDISEYKQIKEKEQLAASVFDNTLDGIIITDPRGAILQVNKAFTRITGYSPQDVIGKTPRFLNSGQQEDAFYSEMWRSLKEDGAWQGELWDRHKDGHVFPLKEKISCVRDARGHIVRYIAIFYDITEQKLSERRIHRLAHYDVLTNLPNRVLFVDRLRHALERSKREGTQMALLFVDLDHFKNINDSLGHPMGDALLQQVAEKLSHCVRREDTVARIGGDEFTILLEGVKGIFGIQTVSRKILKVLSNPFHIHGHKTFISGSIGISVHPEDAHDADTLLKNADLAMYRAKELGRNRYQFYARKMAEEASERLQIQNALRQALECQEFLLHYQPLIKLEDRAMVGAEALIRWQHPHMGLIAPGKFVPLAEESRQMNLIGEWVLRTACLQLRAWLDAGFSPLRMAVNISGQQLKQKDLAKTARQVIEETNCPAELMDLEITETFIMREAEESVKELKRLREIGFELAIDDFGTGYSSLSYLKRLPVTKLKLDRSFVKDIREDPNDEAIARAIIGLGKSLGLTVIAEGIETGNHETFLITEGCHQGQGFLYGRPVPARDFEAFLEA